jgi:hypothetical protein
MSTDMSIQSCLKRIEIYSDIVSEMKIDEYDEKAIIAMFNLVCEINERGGTDEKNMSIVYLYDALKSKAGIMFCCKHKLFAQMAVTQAINFLSQIANSTYEVFIEVKRAITDWFDSSDDMLRAHEINYSIPIYISEEGTDNVDDLNSRELDDFISYERNMEDDYNEYEYDYEYGYEYDDYNENHDLEHEDEDDEEYQYVDEHIDNIVNYKTKILAGQIAEKKKFENDPFYQAALSLVKEKSKKLDETKESTEKLQIDTVRDIVRREIEVSSDIESNSFFRCNNYKVIERLTGEKVTDYITKKIGANISIKYSDVNDVTLVYVFDGIINHEFTFNINMIEMIGELKKEIRKDTSQALYDVGYCKDISCLISQYIC